MNFNLLFLLDFYFAKIKIVYICEIRYNVIKGDKNEIN